MLLSTRRGILSIVWLCIASIPALAQGNKISITAGLPASLTVCGGADTFSVNLLNITAGGINNITFTAQLPGGINYVPSSVTGSGVAESNISNLNAPVFSVPNMVVGSSYSFKFRANALCGVITYLNGGGAISNTYTANYTGNFDRLVTNPYTIKIPNLVITSVTNQTYNGNLNDVFVRTFTITNTGQGSVSGFTFRQINKNGLQLLYYNGGTTAASGDTITHSFGAAQFAGIGNFNGLFDYQESITFRDTIKVIACTNINSTFSVWWGCNGSICQQNSSAGNVILNQQLPNVLITSQPSLNTCYGANNISTQQLTLRNSGNGPAKNFILNVFQPGNYYSRIDTSSIQVKTGVNGTFVRLYPTSVTNTSSAGTLSCLGTNPIGAFVATFANIPAGDTLFLKWNAYTCCPQVCNGYPATMGWQYNATYKDQCLTNNYSIVTNWGRVYDQSGMSLLPATPSDIITGQTKAFKYLITNYSLFSMNAANTDFELNVVLPPGIKWISGNISNTNGTAFWNPSSSSYAGNIYKAFFTGPPPFNLLQGEFNFNLQGDCSMTGASTGNKTISITFNHRPNRSCTDSCSIPILCVSTNVYLHCGSSCPGGGMIFQNYTIQRSSFGRPDNNDDGLPDTSGVLNMAKVRAERAMVGDTITAVFTGVVKTGGPNPNFQYGYAHSAIVNGSYLTDAGATVRIKRGANGAIYNCNTVSVSSSTVGTTRTFAYDFSIPTVGSFGGCISPSYRYSSNDTITLTVKYKVGALPGGAVLSSTVSNDYYLCNVPNPTLAGNIFECDTFSGNFTLIGYYFTNYGKNTFSHNSCSNISVSQSYYLSIGNCCSNYGGGNLFPYEYRSWAHLNKATFIKPAGYTFVSAAFNQVRTAGTLLTATQSVASLTPVNPASDTLVFNTEALYKGYGGSIDSSDDGFHGTLTVTLAPTCAVVQNVAQQFPTIFVFKEHASLSNGLINFPPGGETDEGTYVGPNITIAAALDTVKGLGDTAYWDITVFNTSGASSASNVWLAFQTTPTTTVTGVTDNTGAAVASVNGIYKLGTMNASSQKTYRVKATYRSCFKDSIQIFTGANCPAYPASLSAYNCNKASRTLYVTPQMPGFQASITDSISTLNLCTVSPYTMVINNIQEATAYNVRVQITLPMGLTIFPGSTRLYYPFSSAARSISDPVLISGTTYEWNLSSLDTTISKYGIKGVVDTSRSSVKIKFYVKTDCNYSSGGILRIKILSTSACGATAPQLQAVSNQLKIIGVTTPYFTLVQMNSDTINPCGSNSTLLKVHIFNIGNDSTRFADYYQVTLPAGMQYVAGSFVPVHNAPAVSVPTISVINGQQLLEWQIPPLIPRIDSVDFTFKITVTDHRPLLCGRNDIYSQAVVKQSVLCVATNTNCLINSITGYCLTPMIIQKGSLTFTAFNGSAQAQPPANEILNISYTLQNSGARIDSLSTLYVKFYFDADSNGVNSNGDYLLAVDTVNKTQLTGTSFTRGKTITAPAGKTCTLIAVADTGSCLCATSQRLLLNPPLPCAGADKVLCSAFSDTLGIDSLSGYIYSWLPLSGLSNANVARPLVSIINTNTAIQNFRYFVTAKRGSCSYTDTVNVQVYPAINANAGPDKTICPGDSTSIGSVATGGTPPFRYKWLVTTGMNTDTLASTWIKPTVNTRYIVKVTDALLCVNYDTVDVFISPWPTARFGVSNSCVSDSVQFTDSSTVSAGVVSAWFWNFGDGGTSFLQHPKHKYNAAGVYMVKLRMQSNYGCKDSTTLPVTVYPLPKAGFKATAECRGDSTRFTDTSSVSSGTIAQWNWDFGDGDTSTLQHPVHLYTDTGNYTVLLTIFTAQGCMDTVSRVLRIDPKPVAGFSTMAGCLYDSVAFTDTSSIVQGSIVQWLWDFGDSITSTLQNPRHRYVYAGTRNVTLWVTSSGGCTDSITHGITVNPVPTANFITADACHKDSVYFNNTSTGAGSYLWYFGDGQTSTNTSPSHYYALPGTYTVKLVTTNAFGCTDSISRSVGVHPKPAASFFSAAVCEYDSAVFNNSSTISGGSINSYLWYFGDGQTSTLKNPKHLYAGGGTYTVSLKVMSDKFCTDSTSASLTIYSKPGAAFSASVACHNDTTFFTDNSVPNSGVIIQHFWDFGDGNTSSVTNPIHKYTDTGYFTVKLRVVSSTNCTDSTQSTIYVNPVPVVDFISADACEDMARAFFDNSVITRGKNIRHYWRFGDGDTSTAKDPAHVYANPGNYNVTLRVTSDSACETEITKPVIVYPKPNPGFYIVSTCYRDSVSFVNTASVNAPYTIQSYLYRFGDGSTSTLPNPKHKYASAGSYNVTIICTTDKGCVDSVTNLIKVASIPEPGFFYTQPCIGDSVQFTDTSVAASPITYRKWYFGDGSTSFLQNPRHWYASPGTYMVSLLCRNGNNCFDSVAYPVTIYPKPKALFTAGDVCPGTTIPLTNLSTGNGSIITKYFWSFSDGYTDTSRIPQHACVTPGLMRILLRIETEFGCTDTLSRVVRIFMPPAASFTFDTVCVGSATHFYDLSVANAPSLVWWEYDFGDSTTYTGANATHTYTYPGYKYVTLRIRNSNGCTDSIVRQVLVTEVPAPDFFSNINDGCLPLTVQFTDLSHLNIGTKIKWEWDFGDGSTDLSQNPVHTYTKAGNYSIRLRVTSSYGCTGQYTMSNYIQVYGPPVADFDALPDSTTDLKPDIKFRDRSYRAAYWNWNFGNAQSSTEQNPSVTYDDTGHYNVELIVMSPEGCIDSVRKKVVITPGYRIFIPNAFSPNKDDRHLNEKWGPGGMYKGVKQYSLHIYDRWGNEVFQTNDIYEFWDGTMPDRKTPATEDMYIYMMNVIDYNNKDHYYRGTLYLIR